MDSFGKGLGDYAPFTVEDKIKKGQIHDHITLSDTWEFYESFIISLFPEYFEISADPIKNGSNLFDDFGKDIIGLTEESLQKLREIILPLLQQETKLAIAA